MTRTVDMLMFMFLHTAWASQTCSHDEGGGICPENTKCCPMMDMDGNLTSGCLPYSHHIDGPGTCCGGDVDEDTVNAKHSNDGGDYGHHGIATACPGYYQCAHGRDSDSTSPPSLSSSLSLSLSSSPPFDDYDSSAICILKDDDGNVVKQMPRYAIVAVPPDTIENCYGFPLKQMKMERTREGDASLSTSTSAAETVSAIPVLAYYSNQGPITISSNNSSNPRIKAVIIIVHGSGRNADGYLYAAMSASQLQHTYSPDEIMIVAPRFLVPEDNVRQVPVVGHDGSITFHPPLQWNETDPIPHTWRYGANALPPWEDVSSYDAMDALVEHFVFQSNIEQGVSKRGKGRGGKVYQNLERVVVAGHSAGGQFTHRWALTSNSAAWGDDDDDDDDVDNYDDDDDQIGHADTDTTSTRASTTPNELRAFSRKMLRSELHNHHNDNNDDDDHDHNHIDTTHHPLRTSISLPKVTAVVANPRSFCYLDERRFRDVYNSSSPLEIPSEERQDQCPTYNAWEWGLDEGGLPCPYRDRAVMALDGNTTRLALRYSKRNVIYLAGGNDTDHLHSSCEDDDFQGVSRLQRSHNFFESMKIIFGEEAVSRRQERMVVKDVIHDHTLILQSREGLYALFGDDYDHDHDKAGRLSEETSMEK